jgi:hypothetical protein
MYPDPLLAPVLAASTYWDEIPDAAARARQHSFLTGNALAEAIRQDNLLWPPSVIALLPLPSVLEMMARDSRWTQRLEDAVVNQPEDVLHAIQYTRRKAVEFGYLRSNNCISVKVNQGYIEILPAEPGAICVPAAALHATGEWPSRRIDSIRPRSGYRSFIRTLGLDGSPHSLARAHHRDRPALRKSLGRPGRIRTPVQ